jgi:male germ cell-associated kinase
VYLITERLSSDLYEFIGEHPNGVGEVREKVREPVTPSCRLSVLPCSGQTLAKRVISPIIEAVLFMHSKGFVHRDLKPENILLDYTGLSTSEFVIKVCDFGLCERIHDENAILTGESATHT